MFKCKGCGKNHQKTSSIGRAHWNLYMKPLADAIAADKPDPKVHEEVVAEAEQANARVREVFETVMDISANMYGNPVPQEKDTWDADPGTERRTTYWLDRFLIDNHSKRMIKYIIEGTTVTKNHEEYKAIWRIPSWEDKKTHAFIPFTLDEEDKYAMIIDARNKRKTGVMRKRRMFKALKEAAKPYEVPQ